MYNLVMYCAVLLWILWVCEAVHQGRGKYVYVDTMLDYEEIPIEERLFKYIFRKYTKDIRPVVHPTQSVHVNITYSLLQIHSLDEKTQVFRTYGWLVVEWRDPRLVWPKEDFANMTQFIVDSEMLWTPELALINAVEYQFPDFSQYRAILHDDGRIRWEPAGVFETSCKINIAFYPYDRQVCELVFGTWTFTSFQVNLSHSTPEVITDDYNTSGEWDIQGTRMDTRIFKYQCCPNLRFSKVSATIMLKRKHRFYTMNLVLPCAMLSSLTLVTFLSPPDQGEKMSLGISILLSFSVFMLSLSENMPKTSDGLPLLGIFSTYVMLMNTTSVMLTVFVLNLHHRHDNKPIPRWVRSFILTGLARVLCMSKNEKREGSPYIRAGLWRTYARKRSRDSRDVSIAYATEQMSGRIARHHVNTNPVNTYNAYPASRRQHSLDGNHYRSDVTVTKNNTDCASTGHEERANKELRLSDPLLNDPFVEENTIDDWRELARIMDRLFFCFTLVAMLFFCATVLIITWT